MVANKDNCEIENNIFDGEGLLDASIFKQLGLSKKGMMLLRNRFFKCCAFNTNLQKWFKDNHIKSVNQLNLIQGVTFAKDIKDVLLVVSESCLKYLKMVDDGFNEANIKRWCDAVSDENGDSLFGIVKTDKRTRFFHGDMVETTYQLLNTLQFSFTDIKSLIYPYVEYINYIKDIEHTPEFARFYLEGELDENDDEEYEDDSEGDESEELLSYSPYSFKDKVCLELIKIDERTRFIQAFKEHIYEHTISSFAWKLYNGRALVNGTYATLFGNPYEFLNYIILKDGKPIFNKENEESILGKDEIYCSFFADGTKLVGSRAPHITMGNILLAHNVRDDRFKTYFNLSDNIVVVDAINNNIQHRLNGCDYDSDSMLLTDDKTIVDIASLNYDNFAVPYGDAKSFKPVTKRLENFSKDNKENVLRNLHKIDAAIANNNVGTIINLSQLLNSNLWHSRNKSRRFNYDELYNRICILAVLSGAEIDSAKKTFGFNTGDELEKVRKYAKDKGYDKNEPMFFVNVSNKKEYKLRIGEIVESFETSKRLKTTMDYLWDAIFEADLPRYYVNTLSLFDLINEGFSTDSISGAKYDQVRSAIETLKKMNKVINQNRRKKKNANNYELVKLEFQDSVKQCYKEIHLKINNPTKAKLLIKLIEKEKEASSILELFLYIVYLKHEDLGYSLIDLFNEKHKGVRTLKRVYNNKSYEFKIFNRYNYQVDKFDILMDGVKKLSKK